MISLLLVFSNAGKKHRIKRDSSDEASEQNKKLNTIGDWCSAVECAMAVCIECNKLQVHHHHLHENLKSNRLKRSLGEKRVTMASPHCVQSEIIKIERMECLNLP